MSSRKSKKPQRLGSSRRPPRGQNSKVEEIENEKELLHKVCAEGEIEEIGSPIRTVQLQTDHSNLSSHATKSNVDQQSSSSNCPPHIQSSPVEQRSEYGHQQLSESSMHIDKHEQSNCSSGQLQSFQYYKDDAHTESTTTEKTRRMGSTHRNHRERQVERKREERQKEELKGMEGINEEEGEEGGLLEEVHRELFGELAMEGQTTQHIFSESQEEMQKASMEEEGYLTSYISQAQSCPRNDDTTTHLTKAQSTPCQSLEFTAASMTEQSKGSDPYIVDVHHTEAAVMDTLVEQSEITSHTPKSQCQKEEAHPVSNTSGQRRKMGSTRRTLQGYKGEKKKDDRREVEDETEDMKQIREEGSVTNPEGGSTMEFKMITERKDGEGLDEKKLEEEGGDGNTVVCIMQSSCISKQSQQELDSSNDTELPSGRAQRAVDNERTESHNQAYNSSQKEETGPFSDRLNQSEGLSFSKEVYSVWDGTDGQGEEGGVSKEEALIENTEQGNFEEPTKVDQSTQQIFISLQEERQSLEFTAVLMTEQSKRSDPHVIDIHQSQPEEMGTLSEQIQIISYTPKSEFQEEETHQVSTTSGQRRKMGSTRRTLKGHKGEKKKVDRREVEEKEDMTEIREEESVTNPEGGPMMQELKDRSSMDNMGLEDRCIKAEDNASPLIRAYQSEDAILNRENDQSYLYSPESQGNDITGERNQGEHKEREEEEKVQVLTAKPRRGHGALEGESAVVENETTKATEEVTDVYEKVDRGSVKEDNVVELLKHGTDGEGEGLKYNIEEPVLNTSQVQFRDPEKEDKSAQHIYVSLQEKEIVEMGESLEKDRPLPSCISQTPSCPPQDDEQNKITSHTPTSQCQGEEPHSVSNTSGQRRKMGSTRRTLQGYKGEKKKDDRREVEDETEDMKQIREEGSVTNSEGGSTMEFKMITECKDGEGLDEKKLEEEGGDGNTVVSIMQSSCISKQSQQELDSSNDTELPSGRAQRAVDNERTESHNQAYNSSQKDEKDTFSERLNQSEGLLFSTEIHSAWDGTDGQGKEGGVSKEEALIENTEQGNFEEPAKADKSTQQIFISLQEERQSLEFTAAFMTEQSKSSDPHVIDIHPFKPEEMGTPSEQIQIISYTPKSEFQEEETHQVSTTSGQRRKMGSTRRTLKGHKGEKNKVDRREVEEKEDMTEIREEESVTNPEGGPMMQELKDRSSMDNMGLEDRCIKAEDNASPLIRAYQSEDTILNRENDQSYLYSPESQGNDITGERNQGEHKEREEEEKVQVLTAKPRRGHGALEGESAVVENETTKATEEVTDMYEKVDRGSVKEDINVVELLKHGTGLKYNIEEPVLNTSQVQFRDPVKEDKSAQHIYVSLQEKEIVEMGESLEKDRPLPSCISQTPSCPPQDDEQNKITSHTPTSQCQGEEPHSVSNTSGQRRKMGSTRRTLQGYKGEKKKDDRREVEDETEDMKQIREEGSVTNSEGGSTMEFKMITECKDGEGLDEKKLEEEGGDGNTVVSIMQSSCISNQSQQELDSSNDTELPSGRAQRAVDNERTESHNQAYNSSQKEETGPFSDRLNQSEGLSFSKEVYSVWDGTDGQGEEGGVSKEEALIENTEQGNFEEPTKVDQSTQQIFISLQEERQSLEFTAVLMTEQSKSSDPHVIDIHQSQPEEMGTLSEQIQIISYTPTSEFQEEETHQVSTTSGQRRKMGSTRRTLKGHKGEKKKVDRREVEEKEDMTEIREEDSVTNPEGGPMMQELKDRSSMDNMGLDDRCIKAEDNASPLIRAYQAEDAILNRENDQSYLYSPESQGNDISGERNQGEHKEREEEEKVQVLTAKPRRGHGALEGESAVVENETTKATEEVTDMYEKVDRGSVKEDINVVELLKHGTDGEGEGLKYNIEEPVLNTSQVQFRDPVKEDKSAQHIYVSLQEKEIVEMGESLEKDRPLPSCISQTPSCPPQDDEQNKITSHTPTSQCQGEEPHSVSNTSGQRRKMGSTRRTLQGYKGEKKKDDRREVEDETEDMKQIREEGSVTNPEGGSTMEFKMITERKDGEGLDEKKLEEEGGDGNTVVSIMQSSCISNQSQQELDSSNDTELHSGRAQRAVDNERTESHNQAYNSSQKEETGPFSDRLNQSEGLSFSKEVYSVWDGTDGQGEEGGVSKEEALIENTEQGNFEEPTKVDQSTQHIFISLQEERQSLEFTAVLMTEQSKSSDPHVIDIHQSQPEEMGTLSEQIQIISYTPKSEFQEEEIHQVSTTSGQRRKMGSTRRTLKGHKGEKNKVDRREVEEKEDMTEIREEESVTNPEGGPMMQELKDRSSMDNMGLEDRCIKAEDNASPLIRAYQSEDAILNRENDQSYLYSPESQGNDITGERNQGEHKEREEEEKVQVLTAKPRRGHGALEGESAVVENETTKATEEVTDMYEKVDRGSVKEDNVVELLKHGTDGEGEGLKYNIEEPVLNTSQVQFRDPVKEDKSAQHIYVSLQEKEIVEMGESLEKDRPLPSCISQTPSCPPQDDEQNKITSHTPTSQCQGEEPHSVSNTSGQRRKMGSTRRTLRGYKREKKKDDRREVEDETEDMKQIREEGSVTNPEGGSTMEFKIITERKDGEGLDEKKLEEEGGDGNTVVSIMQSSCISNQSQQELDSSNDTELPSGRAQRAVDNERTESHNQAYNSSQKDEKDTFSERLNQSEGLLFSTEVHSAWDGTDGQGEEGGVSKEEALIENTEQGNFEEPAKADKSTQQIFISLQEERQSLEFTAAFMTEQSKSSDPHVIDIHPSKPEEMGTPSEQIQIISYTPKSEFQEEETHQVSTTSGQRRKMGSTRRTLKGHKGEKNKVDRREVEEKEDMTEIREEESVTNPKGGPMMQELKDRSSMDDMGLEDGYISTEDNASPLIRAYQSEDTILKRENDQSYLYSPESQGNDITGEGNKGQHEEREEKEQVQGLTTKARRGHGALEGKSAVVENETPKSTEEVREVYENVGRSSVKEDIMVVEFVEHGTNGTGEGGKNKMEGLVQNASQVQFGDPAKEDQSAQHISVSLQEDIVERGATLEKERHLQSCISQPPSYPPPADEQSEITSHTPKSQGQEDEAHLVSNTSGQRRKMGSSRRTLRGHKGEKMEDIKPVEEEVDYMKEIKEERGVTNTEAVSTMESKIITEPRDVLPLFQSPHCHEEKEQIETNTSGRRKMRSTRKSHRGQEVEKKMAEGDDDIGDIEGVIEEGVIRSQMFSDPKGGVSEDKKEYKEYKDIITQDNERNSQSNNPSHHEQMGLSARLDQSEVMLINEEVKDYHVVHGCRSQLAETSQLSQDPAVSATKPPSVLTESISTGKKRKMGSTRRNLRGGQREKKTEDKPEEETEDKMGLRDEGEIMKKDEGSTIEVLKGLDDGLSEGERERGDSEPTKLPNRLELSEGMEYGSKAHLIKSSQRPQDPTALTVTQFTSEDVSTYYHISDSHDEINRETLSGKCEHTSLSLKLPPLQSCQGEEQNVQTESNTSGRRRKMGSTRKNRRGREVENRDERGETGEEAESIGGLINVVLEGEMEAVEEPITVKVSSIQKTEENQESYDHTNICSNVQQDESFATAAKQNSREGRRKMGSRRTGQGYRGKGESHLGELEDGVDKKDPQNDGFLPSCNEDFQGKGFDKQDLQVLQSDSNSGLEKQPISHAVLVLGHDCGHDSMVVGAGYDQVEDTGPSGGVMSTEGTPSPGLITFSQTRKGADHEDRGWIRTAKINLKGDSISSDSDVTLYNVVMVGNSSVGKTSFMRRFQSGEFCQDHCATIGIDSCIQTIAVDGRIVKLQIWDTAGQERYHSITRQVFHKAQGLLLMYDITSTQSFCAVRDWISCIQEGAPDDVIIMLLGNKNDCTEREVFQHEGGSLAREYSINFMECSAASGDNVSQSMEALARLLMQKMKKEEECTMLHKEPPRKKSGCC